MWVCREQVRTYLRKVYDLERLATKVNCGSANGRDLLSLRDSLGQLPALIGVCSRPVILKSFGGGTGPLDDVHGLLARSINEVRPSPSQKET